MLNFLRWALGEERINSREKILESQDGMVVVVLDLDLEDPIPTQHEGDLGPVIISQPSLPHRVAVRTKRRERTMHTTLSSLEERWHKNLKNKNK